MSEAVKSLTAPVTSGERHVLMDVLRGFALMGVLIANLAGLGGPDFMATTAQLEALSSAAIDEAVHFGLELFVYDKANTLFAFLFGLGFWIQMERLEARGDTFKSIYLRRITILFLIGVVHMFALFAFDILHLYGAMAFILFFCRKLSAQIMLRVGLAFLILGMPVIMGISYTLGIADAAFGVAYSDEAALVRQDAALAGNYMSWISRMNHMVIYDWFASGLLIGWIFYVLGRFFMGAWVARQGWIQKAPDHLPMFRKWLWPLLLGGLALQLISQLPGELELAEGTLVETLLPYVIDFLHAFATPMIAAGYVCALALIFNGKNLPWLVRIFAPVGQMALTNYLGQSVIITLVLTNIGPGLGLVGSVGTATYLSIALAVFAAQIAFSHLWMKSFVYGPAEWVWRTLTYGNAPSIRRATPA